MKDSQNTSKLSIAEELTDIRKPIEIGNISVEFPATENDISIEEYLRGCVGFEVTGSAISTILIDRGIAPGTDVTTLEKRQKDLCRADLYMWCASTPSVTGSVEDANGVWKHKEGGTQSSAYDKRNLRQMANDIYALYGENVRKSSVRIVNFGMNMNKRYPL